MAKKGNTLSTKSNKIWERPTIVPLPLATEGVGNPVISLNGRWKINIDPPAEFWSNKVDPAPWPDMEVPGDLQTEEFVIEEDHEYAFKRKIEIPSDYSGKKIILRFDGVTGYCRVWINGEYIRDHYGGFTSWDCDITDYVSPGGEAWLTVEATDKTKEICIFNAGGIIRDVELIALPQDYVTRFQVETDLDSDYNNAILKVTAAISLGENKEGEIKLTLIDPQGDTITINPSSIKIKSDNPEIEVDIPISSPLKWDAEHPNLYTLEGQVVVGSSTVETLSLQVGFRKIERVENKLYVNGKEVKLRGVNRHDVHPIKGRAITPELVEQDVKLFKEANVNFIRTSHYAPRKDFLQACDEHGIYVESEIAVAFVGQFNEQNQKDPDYTSKYMNQFAEMIETNRSHPCIIMWSLANESNWGMNFQKQYDYAVLEDPGRPTIFSYPTTMPEGTEAYDIWSTHYADYDSDTGKQTDTWSRFGPGVNKAPVLHDEYAHGSCYNHSELMRDPGVRNFWGESIKRWWKNIFTTEGALGGAIWGGIDEVMVGGHSWGNIMAPEGYSWAFEWGIIDGWRRKKPEHWLTKKAYSPIRIEETPLPNPGEGNPLPIPIKNWFDHTNLNEVDVHWSIGEEAGAITGPDLEPRGQGVLSIPARDWKDGEVVKLKFKIPNLKSQKKNSKSKTQNPKPETLVDEYNIDEYNLVVGTTAKNFPSPQGPAPEIVEDSDVIKVTGDDFDITFSKTSGLITRGIYKNSEIIKGGPYLNLVGIQLPKWSLKNITAKSEENQATVEISGNYGSIDVGFEVRIDAAGLITTKYTVVDLPINPPKRRRLRAGEDVGGYREIGVAYILSEKIDRTTWDSDALWSAYPEDHIGRSSGVAYRVRSEGKDRYRVRPNWPWSHDMKTLALFGKYDVDDRGSNDFRSMRHNIRFASALMAGRKERVRAESDGSDAVRLEVLRRPGLKIDDRDTSIKYVGSWIEIDGDSRNYEGTETYSKEAGDYVELNFKGTAIRWIGNRDTLCGKANVYLDGVKEASNLNLHSGIPHGSSRGVEKIHQQVLFSKDGMENKTHTIKIIVTGQKDPQASNAFVSIDAFEVPDPEGQGDIRFLINNEWNYPELSWGNYVKEPILLSSGYTNTVRMRLTDSDG